MSGHPEQARNRRRRDAKCTAQCNARSLREGLIAHRSAEMLDRSRRSDGEESSRTLPRPSGERRPQREETTELRKQWTLASFLSLSKRRWPVARRRTVGQIRRGRARQANRSLGISRSRSLLRSLLQRELLLLLRPAGQARDLTRSRQISQNLLRITGMQAPGMRVPGRMAAGSSRIGISGRRIETVLSGGKMTRLGTAGRPLHTGRRSAGRTANGPLLRRRAGGEAGRTVDGRSHGLLRRLLLDDGQAAAVSAGTNAVAFNSRYHRHHYRHP
mmetsp:Transcript_33236/g.72530  ORF Transcript_33236/g.72530 Transcript_33236/m.72530 type:complete len:273 (-) Transcript_33236:1379-2197(-)